MSKRSPYRRREVEIVVKDPDTRAGLDKICHALSATAVQEGDTIRIRGTYAVHGNSERDVRNRVERAGLEIVELQTVKLEQARCTDPNCAACYKTPAPIVRARARRTPDVRITAGGVLDQKPLPSPVLGAERTVTNLNYVDCQALGANGVALGAALEGFSVQHRVALPGGFGNESANANRHLLGDAFDQETGEQDSWTAQDRVAYLNGTPPCSGFSSLNQTKVGVNQRGPDSNINHCQRALVQYAARCTGSDGLAGPEIVAFESVRDAWVMGRALMTEYLAMLRELTGQPYVLHHLLHSDASLGGVQDRPRYFWLASRIPFTPAAPPQVLVPTLREVIGDLEDLDNTIASQDRIAHPSAWAEVLADTERVDWHGANENLKWNTIVSTLIDDVGWEYAQGIQTPLRAYIEKHGSTPPGAEKWWDFENDKLKMFESSLRRLDPDRRGAWVLTGGADRAFIHYAWPRGLTAREVARMMSLPDSWSLDWARHPSQAMTVLAKNCPLTSGRWVARLARAALEGAQPGGTSWEELALEEVGENEYASDFTRRWKTEGVPADYDHRAHTQKMRKKGEHVASKKVEVATPDGGITGTMYPPEAIAIALQEDELAAIRDLGGQQTVDEAIAEAQQPAVGELKIQKTAIRDARERFKDRGADREGDEFDQTQLHEGGHGERVHRDYAAHYFRWGWAARMMRSNPAGGVPKPKVLDVGSGEDLPMAKLSEYPNEMPAELVCVDLNKIDRQAALHGQHRKKWVHVYGETNFCDIEVQRELYRNHGQFDIIVNFEVIEHMTPAHGDELLLGFHRLLKDDGFVMLSTPVFNGERAANHIHEYTIDELDAKVRAAGFDVAHRYGTFINHNDARKGIKEWAAETGADLPTIELLYSSISEFLGVHNMANFLAPILPDWSRNNVWKLVKAKEGEA